MRIYEVVGDVDNVKFKRVVVFDIDGVLVNDSERINAILRSLGVNSIPSDRELRRRFWEIYFTDKYMELNKPVEKYIRLARELSKSFPIVIITYRVYETQHVKTVEQLNIWGVPFTSIVFRKQEARVRPPDYKLTVIRDLRLNVYKAFDDSEEVCEAYRKNSIDVECVKDAR